MANWRSHRETAHFFEIGDFRRFWHYKNKERPSKGLDVKCHIRSACLDASRVWFSTGIHSINRASAWLWLKPKRPLKMAKMCTVSRLERQCATLCLFHAPTGGGWSPSRVSRAQRFMCSLPEPPKGVGKEGVGNSSTGLVSVQDWQPLLNPLLTLSKPDFARSPDS